MPKVSCLLLLLILTGCTGSPYISFNIEAADITHGEFIVRNDEQKMIYSDNIKNGVLKLDKQYIEQRGYFTFTITDDSKKKLPEPFDIYLEPGQYDIKPDKTGKNYPEITSTSSIQQELSTYYHFLKAATNKKDAEKEALIKLLKKYPQSTAAVHIMDGLNYHDGPAPYYAIFKSFSNEARNSDEGKNIGSKLAALVNLLPGHPAPNILGKTPDGKPFNNADFKSKKIYLVEFWKSGNPMGRENHSEVNMKNLLNSIDEKKDFGIISISLDHNRNWWLGAIKDDHLSWTQFSDLKGNESDNVTNWDITHLPDYYLVDVHWNIVEKDLAWGEISVTVNQYLKHH